jgi:hypothetical protein
MPTNLPPQCQAQYRKVIQSRSPLEKLENLKLFLSMVPKHKHTERLRLNVKRQITSLEVEIEERRKRKVGSGAKFFVRKEGAAQLILLGPTNAGRSSLLAAATGARPQIAPYPFTTRLPVPGMLPFQDLQFQLIEAPALMAGAADGISWGPQVLTLARNADGLIIVVDLSSDPASQLESALTELKKAGITAEPPSFDVEMKLDKKGTGIRVVVSGRLLDCTVTDIEHLLRGFKISNAVIRIAGSVSIADVEDAIFQSKLLFKPTLVVANKLDAAPSRSALENLRRTVPSSIPLIATSSKTGEGLDSLGEEIFRMLKLVRVYTKEVNEAQPSKRPVVLREGATVESAAKHVHSSLARLFKYARIWGPSGKYDGERVGLEHRLKDGDVVEIHIR